MKKTLTITLTLILLFSITVAVTCVDYSKADPFYMAPERLPTEQGYIRSDGSIEPNTLPIQRDGNSYRFTDNMVNYSLTIETDYAVIDGDGFSLALPAYGEVSENGATKFAKPLISVSNRSNIIIKNVNFFKCSFAIEIENSTNIIIFKNKMSNCGTGIYCKGSSECSLVANELSSAGVTIKDCTSFNISHNRSSQNTYGANIFTLGNSNVTRNSFSNNLFFGLYFNGDHINNQIYANNFINNDVAGLSFAHTPSGNNSFSGNYWSGNPVEILDYFQERQDPTPLSNQVSIEFKQPPFTLPTNSPAPTATTPIPTTPANNKLQFNQTTLLAVIAVCAVAVCAGLAAYFKKYVRHRR